MKANETSKIGFTTILFNVIMIFLAMAVTSCGGSDSPDEPSSLQVSITLPSEIKALPGETVSLVGTGVEVNGKIKLASTTNSTLTFMMNVDKVENSKLYFTLPAVIPSGDYSMTYSKGTASKIIGITHLDTSVDAGDLADKDGMTLKGYVRTLAGTAVQGVVVSDGYQVTTTDADGVYYLASKKETGFVFISVPGNYEVSNSYNLPQFYARLAGNATVVERNDFTLTPVNNENHTLLTLADMHLANRSTNNDIAQYESGFITDVNATIAKYEGLGTKVYGLTLGDQSWDRYWYENNYAIAEATKEMRKINTTIFNCPGNHDNDPYIANNDWAASAAYRLSEGPTYYSFNLGKVHYIVLDDVEYINKGASNGTIGDRDYNRVVVASQMDWLKKDLATVADKSTPIVVAMHVPLFHVPTVSGNGSQSATTYITNSVAVQQCFAAFSNVKFMTGHTHVNYTVKSTTTTSITEYNTAAVCATWWWTGKTGYAGNHICVDGTPGGYGIWRMNGVNSTYNYKSIGYDEDYQFRVYDLNKVLIDESYGDYTKGYEIANTNNEILVNVFAYGPGWSITVTENGTSLPVTRLRGYDPLHIISYECQRLNHNATPTTDFCTAVNAHLFKAKAASATSPVVVTVKDEWGKTYTETVTRPKAFSTSMK